MNQTIRAFGYPNNLIKEFIHRVVLIRPKQITVGSLIVASKSDAKHMGELDSQQWAEFAKVCNEVESTLVAAFGADKFNYLALMMKDPNVHFHLIPRYANSVVLGGRRYEDPDWPLKTEMKSIDMSNDHFAMIKSRLYDLLSRAIDRQGLRHED